MADPISGVNRGNSIVPTGATQTGSSTTVGRVDSVEAGTPKDSANVSNTAGLLEVMAQAGTNASAVDETKVQALHDAIASGSFRPDPQQVAQKMVEWEAQLAGRNTP
jgi:flagellar biosynthesis anti-sigma factor FlgM